MERKFIYSKIRTQYFKDIYSPIFINKFYAIPINISTALYADFKINMEEQRTKKDSEEKN